MLKFVGGGMKFFSSSLTGLMSLILSQNSSLQKKNLSGVYTEIKLHGCKLNNLSYVFNELGHFVNVNTYLGKRMRPVYNRALAFIYMYSISDNNQCDSKMKAAPSLLNNMPFDTLIFCLMNC